MTLSIVPVDAAGIDNIAEGLSGFVDETQELQQSMMTTLFISGASEASNGRCAYLLLDDGARMWVPNSLRCWLVDISIKSFLTKTIAPWQHISSPNNAPAKADRSSSCGETNSEPSWRLSGYDPREMASNDQARNLWTSHNVHHPRQPQLQRPCLRAAAARIRFWLPTRG